MLTRFARALAPVPCLVCGALGGALCPTCRRCLPPPVEDARFAHVDRVLCPWDYTGVARRLILDLKLRGLSGAAEPLAEGMTELVQRRGLRAGTLTWVPCRERDRRRRGFDHAEVLARGLSRRLGLPCVGLLERTRDGADQAGLTAAERAQNLHGVFVARSGRGSVALVDDLVTTGATASWCARAMRATGVTGVEVLAACRA